EKAAKQLVALGNPPQDVLQKVRDALKALDATSATATTTVGTPTPAQGLPDKIKKQIEKAGLPTGGAMPFHPKLDKNQKGEPIIRKDTIQHGPRKGKKGYVDSKGKIWIRDR